jgi:DNA-directed RNA polymerase subunit RPC12/RpoP
VLARNQCAVCTNKIVYIGFNDVWTTNPDMAILLYNPDDGYKYTQGSNKKVNWKCQRCGHIIKNKSFANIKHNGLVCPICSDGISVPNKFIAALLDSLDIKFDREKQFDWNINRFYDFYLPENNVIIEVHGLQHYEECGFASKWNLHLKDVKENDKQKQLKAELNGINEYIIIDARYSEIDWLRNHVLTSKLINFYNLENVDWEMCFKKTCTSNLIEACKLHNLGKSDDEIIRTLKISKSGLYLLIRKGRKIKLCE